MNIVTSHLLIRQEASLSKELKQEDNVEKREDGLSALII